MKSHNRGNSECLFYVLYTGALLLMLFSNFIFMDGTIGMPVSFSKVNFALPSFHNEFINFKHQDSQADESFSACLLVMDDNHRLTEWLAYHYHVLPLRYLVIAVDPHSTTSPSKILDQWRGYGMTIVEWNNDNIFNGMLWEYENVILKRSEKPHNHRQRQNMFVRNCLYHMKEANRTWVTVTDVDEYLHFNGREGSTKNYAKVKYPSVRDESSIYKFLKDTMNIPKANMKTPCILIPRILFGAVPSSEDRIHNAVPTGVNPNSFDTLRYRGHLEREAAHKSSLNGWGKCIIDVSRAKWSDFPTAKEAFMTARWQMNIHQPMPKICPKLAVKQDFETLLRINHYVGSWESYSFRQDARGRNQSVWKVKADISEESDDNIRPWISGFVQKQGKERASEMLQMVGVFPPQ